MSVVNKPTPIGRLLLSVAETAEALGIKEQTLRVWLSRGTCPIPSKSVGRRRLFRAKDVIAYAEK